MSAFNLSLKDALDQLDHANQNHWTADGKPRIDTMRLLTGNNQLTREEITAEFPNFVRVVQEFTPPAPFLPFTVEDLNLQEGGASIEDSNLQASLFETSDDDDLSLPELLEIKQDALNVLILKREILDAEIAECQSVVDDLILKAEVVERQSNSNAQVIRSYLDSKIQLADEKAKKLKMIADSGLDLKLLAAELRVSPADQKTRKRV